MKALILLTSFAVIPYLLEAQGAPTNCIDPIVAPSFPGATIAFCETQDEMTYKIPVGPETGYQKISDWVTAQGKATRLFYKVSADNPVSAIFEHYQNELRSNSFASLAERLHPSRNVSKLVGGNKWLVTFYKANKFPGSPEARIDQGSMSLGGTFYLAGELETENGSVYLTIAGKKLNDSENVIMVDAIYPEDVNLFQAAISQPTTRGGVAGTFQAKSPVAGTATLTQQLESSGRAVIYGIQYNFDKYVLKDESAPLLDEIGDLLQSNPSVSIFIVSHTAQAGTWEDKLDLSFQRAESIAQYLQEYHKIDGKRITPYGVGYLAPIAAPGTEEGQAKNERIELLLKMD